MSNEFKAYLFNDLREHAEKLKEASYSESPDGDLIDYHYRKINGIVNLLENQVIVEEMPIRVIGQSKIS